MSQLPIITHAQADRFISNALIAGLAPMLLGDVGAGKSVSFVRYAKKNQLKFIPIYLDSMYEMDVIGYAVPNKTKGKFEYLPCDLFPLEGDEMPINPDTGKPYVGYFILFEEFGNCPPSMQVAAQRVLLEKSIGSHKLASNAYLGVAGNMVSSNTNSRPISAAVRTRCSIAGYDSTSQDYIDDTLAFMLREQFHPSVIEFLRDNQQVMSTPNKTYQEDGESPFLVARTLEGCSNLLKRKTKVKDLQGWYYNNLFSFAAMIGKDNADILGNYITSSSAATGALHEIINSPMSAQLPTSIMETLSVGDFIVTNVKTDKEAKASLIYISRLPKELGKAITNSLMSSNNGILRDAINKHAAPISGITFGG